MNLTADQLAEVRREIAAAVASPEVTPASVQLSGLVPDVVPDTPIVADWGNTIRNRVIQVFATAAERDTWASPPNGSFCFLTDTSTTWRRISGAWRGAVFIIDANGAGLADTVYSTTGLRDILAVVPPTDVLPFPTTMTITTVCYGGFSGSGPASFIFDHVRFSDAVVVGSRQTQSPVANWVTTTIVDRWPVAAGASPAYKTRLNVNVTGGGMYAALSTIWQRTL